VLSVTDPYGRILDFSRQEPLLFLSSSSSVVLTKLFFLVVPGIEPGPPDL
jgi:hypothetical protein